MKGVGERGDSHGPGDGHQEGTLMGGYCYKPSLLRQTP